MSKNSCLLTVMGQVSCLLTGLRLSCECTASSAVGGLWIVPGSKAEPGPCWALLGCGAGRAAGQLCSAPPRHPSARQMVLTDSARLPCRGRDPFIGSGGESRSSSAVPFLEGAESEQVTVGCGGTTESPSGKQQCQEVPQDVVPYQPLRGGLSLLP